MSKKNKEPKKVKVKKPATPMNKELKTGLCIALAFILIFSAGNFLGSLKGSNKATVETTEAAPTEQPTEQPTETTASSDVTEASTLPPATTAATEAPATQAPADPTAAPAPSNGAPQTTAEIIAYFNEAANKIKTEASKVTRNYEDLQHNEEYLEAPGALASIGKGLISTFLKKDETPVDMTGDDLKNNFPVKNQSYVSCAKESDIAEASCTEEGDSYRIKLKFIEATDPTDTGAATAFNIIDPNDVYSNASMIKSFTCKYYDAVIECTVDKASGHVTWINYSLPIIMNVNAQVLVSLDAQVGMTFIDDYTVTY